MPRVLTDEDVSGFRERLIEAAERLFAAHGADGVSMRQLAGALGVSPMTPYRYFKDKDDILAAVRTAGFDRFAESLEAALARGADPVKASRLVGQAYLRFALDHPAAYRLMFDLSQPANVDSSDLIRAAGRARRTMVDHIRALVAAGVIAGELERLAHIFWSAIHGLAVLKLSGMLDPALDVETLLNEQHHALIRGLKPSAAAGDLH